MRRKDCLIALSVAAGVVMCAPSGWAAAQAPATGEAQPVKDDAFNWDFGQVRQGQVVAHVFTFTNQTAKPLRIEGVTTSCGCTVSSVKKKELAAGESTTLEVKFRSKGYQGKVTQFVYLNTDNATQPVFRFTITADVLQ